MVLWIYGLTEQLDEWLAQISKDSHSPSEYRPQGVDAQKNAKHILILWQTMDEKQVPRSNLNLVVILCALFSCSYEHYNFRSRFA